MQTPRPFRLIGIAWLLFGLSMAPFAAEQKIPTKPPAVPPAPPAPPAPAFPLMKDIFPVSDTEEVRRAFDLEGHQGTPVLIVDNFFGGIEVRGGNEQRIELRALRTNRARNGEGLDLAKKDVSLRISQASGRLEIFVDGPFRLDQAGRTEALSGQAGYAVGFDFVLIVPRGSNLVLKTVNEGLIGVKNIEGSFDLQNVAGDIEAEGLAGSGRAISAAGTVKAFFRKNPVSDCLFKSVGGDVEVAFQPGLSAVMTLTSMTGTAESDFAVEHLPPRVENGRDKEGRFVYRNRETRVRTGEGGPTIALETLSGNIRIKQVR